MPAERLLKQLACPECRESLSEASGSIRCGGCGASYPVDEGIPVLARDQDFYYGEIPRQVMEQVLGGPRDRSVVEQLTEHTSDEWLHNYALAPERCLLKYLVDSGPDTHVLDLGAGWGNLSLAMAEHGAEVVAADLTRLRLRFLARRCAEEGIDRVTCVCLGDRDRLPFQPGVFDLVVLNGVLEWVPESIPGNPRAVQREYLREVRRILKPGGQVFIGIENRIGYRYLMGVPEDHTALRFGALLPRPIADVYSRLWRGKPYRTYTYSSAGYRRLLRQAGFASTRLYGVRPNYREPSLIAEYGSRRGMAMAFGRREFGTARLSHPVLGLLGPTRLASALMPSFMIVASAGDNLRGALLEFARQKLGSTTRLVWLGHGDRKGVVALFETGGGPAIGRASMNGEYDARCRRNYDAIALLREHMEGPERDMVPAPLASGELLGRVATFESALPGVPAPQLPRRLLGSAYLGQAESFLEGLRRASRPLAPRAGGTAAREFLDRWLREQQEMFRRAAGATLPDSLVRYVLDHGDCEAVELGPIHGDFAPFNTMIDAVDGRITGVFDWDTYEPESPTFLDRIHLRVYRQYVSGRKETKDKEWLAVMDELLKRLGGLPGGPGAEIHGESTAWWSRSLWAHVVYVIWYRCALARWADERAAQKALRTIEKLLQGTHLIRGAG